MPGACLAIVTLCVPAPASTQSEEVDDSIQTRTEGRLSLVWGDPEPGSDPDLTEPQLALFVSDEKTGETTPIVVSLDLLRSMNGFLAWDDQRVRVYWGDPAGRELGLDVLERLNVPGSRLATALQLLPETERGRELRGGVVSGSQPWVSILCKFSDKSAEPRDLAFFQGMYGNQPGQLDHYWREVSAQNIDIVGSTAIDWVDLPQPQTFYAPTPGSGSEANLTALFNDCTAAADPFVDFANDGTPFAGINQMFNDVLDCCAWGGARGATLDGVSKVWRVTWEPPWAYANAGVIAHEMGHGFGLPHSNNWDGDGSPYDSPWDVMSAATSSHSVVDSTYGRRGTHTIAYHKNRLGWIPSTEQITIEAGQTETVSLDSSSLISSENYRLAIVPIPDSSAYYTVESRLQLGEYDADLPGRAVIIHEVLPERQQPAWAYDADDPPAGFGSNEGTMWRAGETFVDSEHLITIAIDSETTDGFMVTIRSGIALPLFADGFETGDLSGWVQER